MQLKHSIVAAAVATAALPAGILAVGAGASIARTAVEPVAVAAKVATVVLHKTSHGKVLAAGKTGLTLYLFNQDGKNKSNCTGGCAQVWPPLLVKGKPRAGKGVKASKLGEMKRGHSHQVTYAGHPLYGFSGDSKPGQATGEGQNGFYLVSRSGKAIK